MVNRDVDNFSDGVYVMRHDNSLLVKRLQMLSGGIIRVKSDNSMYDLWEITKSQLNGGRIGCYRTSGLDWTEDVMFR